MHDLDCFRTELHAMTVTEKRLRGLEHRVDELEETLEIVSDKKLVRSIERGLKDLKEGRYVRYKDVKSLFRDLERSH